VYVEDEETDVCPVDDVVEDDRLDEDWVVERELLDEEVLCVELLIVVDTPDEGANEPKLTSLSSGVQRNPNLPEVIG
jgi:hypothetical protein